MGQRGGTMGASPPADAAIISASVGSGGVNLRNDVGLIQSLLNLLPSAIGGPTSRLKVDGIAGPLTIGVIRKFQSKNLGVTDGRIDPTGRTLARLSVLIAPPVVSAATSSVRSSFSGSPAPAFAVTAPPAAAAKLAPLDAAIAATPTAKLWTQAATLHLTVLQQGMLASGGVIFVPGIFDIVNTHFHLDRAPTSTIANLGKAIRVFNRILTMLSDPATFYREGPETAKSKFADAAVGGFFLAEPKHHITIRTQYPDCGLNCRAAMLVHEGAHFCGNPGEIIHFAHEFPVPDGEPQDGSAHNYATMTTDEALRNAASYAAFAIHAFFLRDLRFGLDKKSE
jgi:peptidoglycan hydrolase-like protein with peptidoglycan-binding domain